MTLASRVPIYDFCFPGGYIWLGSGDGLGEGIGRGVGHGDAKKTCATWLHAIPYVSVCFQMIPSDTYRTPSDSFRSRSIPCDSVRFCLIPSD